MRESESTKTKLSFFYFCKPSFLVPVNVTGASPPVRAEEVDRTLQCQDSGVESALFYAKAWSKYTKELLAWVDKRVSVGTWVSAALAGAIFTLRSKVRRHVFTS